MSKLYSKTTATYLIDGNSYDIVEIGEGDSPDGWDLYDSKTGECLNLGNVFFQRPCRADIIKHLEKDFIECVNDWFKDHYLHFGCYPIDFEYNNKIYSREECIKFVNFDAKEC